MNMFSFKLSLKKEDWRVVNWSYPSRKKLIEDHAEDLVIELQNIALLRPNKPISFITHSMGGIILRCALNHPDCPKEAIAGRAVLVAPPNRGTSYGRYLKKYKVVRWILGKKAGDQLMSTPYDGFDRLGTFPKHMPVLFISGTAGINPTISGVNDGKVLVTETCLKTPHHHVTFSSGHSRICYSKKVVKEAKNFLQLEIPPCSCSIDDQ